MTVMPKVTPRPDTANGARREPLLTVVVSTREGHALMVASLKSVLADDALPFDLIYIDIMAPPEAAATVQAIGKARGFPVIRHDAWTPPSAARKAALARVETKYVAFVDNDVFVEPGCFARLVACAEETGAGVVAPLYLQGTSERAVSIHMAGGVLQRDDAGALIFEEHGETSSDLGQIDALTRGQVDYVEYHCVLLRTDLAKADGVISDDVLIVHEHIDLSLAARQRGLSVWMEPAARITYADAGGPRLVDLAFFRQRWDAAACEASLEAFCRRWPVGDKERFLTPARSFYRERLQRTAPFHARASGAGLDRPMAPGELAQTRTALREQAQARGYDLDQVKGLELACDFATLIHDGVYRPDGRPFLNHVIGTASALIRYDLRQEVVIAGLLHAAYTHRPVWVDPAEVSRLLTSGGIIDQIVRALPAAKAQLAGGAVVADLSLGESLALAVEAANEADMLLAGEYRACGRPREIRARGAALLEDALGLLGAPGLAASAAGAPGQGAQNPILGFQRLHSSFRLDARNRRVHAVIPNQ
jgi:GT2 family glycosyltransferase